MGDTVGIRYTQTYEGEDSHFLSEYFLIPQRFAVLFLKEGIILIHKIREETKEGLIKITIHILSFLKQRGGRQGTDDVIILASNHLTLYRLIQFLQLFDIICAGIKRLADIFCLNLVRFRQQTIGFFQLLVSLSNRSISQLHLLYLFSNQDGADSQHNQQSESHCYAKKHDITLRLQVIVSTLLDNRQNISDFNLSLTGIIEIRIVQSLLYIFDGSIHISPFIEHGTHLTQSHRFLC